MAHDSNAGAAIERQTRPFTTPWRENANPISFPRRASPNRPRNGALVSELLIL